MLEHLLAFSLARSKQNRWQPFKSGPARRRAEHCLVEEGVVLVLQNAWKSVHVLSALLSEVGRASALHGVQAVAPHYGKRLLRHSDCALALEGRAGCDLVLWRYDVHCTVDLCDGR